MGFRFSDWRSDWRLLPGAFRAVGARIERPGYVAEFQVDIRSGIVVFRVLSRSGAPRRLSLTTRVVAGLPLEVVARSSSYVAVRYLPVLPVPSVDVVGMSSARLRRLSSATGVSALALGAIAKVESASLGDKAHRFEPHVFLRRVGGLSRGDDAYKSVDSLKLLAAEHGISYSPRSGGYVSFVRSETDWSAYELAAALSFDDAVLSSSWGRFQVMGFNFPATFKADLPGTVQRFVENPAEFSDVTLFHWFASRPAAVDAARSADWVSFAVLYNGKAEPYASRISSAYSELAAGGGS